MIPDAMRHIPVEIVRPRPPAHLAKGGLASQAKQVAHAGVGGDTLLVHVNKDEFEQMRRHFGEPTVNPNTGMPQFSPWWGVLGGAAASLLGAGDWLGSGIDNLTGGGLGSAAPAIGSALIGGGVGGLTGGWGGALGGALSGGLTNYLTNDKNLLDGGLSGMFGSGSGSGSTPNGGSVSTSNGAPSPSIGGSASSGSSGGLFQKAGALPYIIGGLLLANTLGQNRGPSADSQAAAAQNSAANAKFNAPLPQATFGRTQSAPLSLANYRRYGMGPAQQFFQNNQLPSLQMAKGGALAQGAKPHAVNASPHAVMGGPGSATMSGPRGPVSGPGDGRSDHVPAMLSNGEYVVDAETTSLLGNGSSDAGAKKLDEFRANLRKHKGGALSQGKFSPDAKRPEQYMKGSPR